jgi:hypothetical protein
MTGDTILTPEEIDDGDISKSLVIEVYLSTIFLIEFNAY